MAGLGVRFTCAVARVVLKHGAGESITLSAGRQYAAVNGEVLVQVCIADS